MREVFKSREQAQQKGRKLQEFVTATFDRAEIARGLLRFASSLAR